MDVQSETKSILCGTTLTDFLSSDEETVSERMTSTVKPVCNGHPLGPNQLAARKCTTPCNFHGWEGEEKGGGEGGGWGGGEGGEEVKVGRRGRGR